MTEPSRTNQELIEENALLKQRIRGLEHSNLEHKRALEALRVNETRYRLLSENAGDVIWTVGMDMRLTYVSPSVTMLLGFTQEEAMARTMQQAFTPPSFEKAMQIFAKEMAIESAGSGDSSRSRMLELELVHKHGKAVPVEGNFCFLRDSTGKAIGILTIVRDITDRKRLEKALQENLSLYFSLIENMLNGFAYCRMLIDQEKPQDFIYLIVNSAFTSLTGLKNVVGKKVSEVIPGIHESDAELLKIYSRVALTGQPEKFEHYFDALKMWLSISVYSPEKEYFVTTFDVITDRKQAEEALRESEERYRHIVETSLEGIWVIDEEFRTKFVNKRISDMLGYAPEEMLGRRVDSFIFAEDMEDYASRVAVRRRGVGEAFERRFRRKDGTTIWNIVSSSPLFDRNGRFTGSFSMFTDITERKRAEEQLQHTLGSLRKAVGTTIQVMVSAVETRDPYTAGHQIRSANLARAIATEMGLPHDKIEAIRMAGSIHDIGKLSIPAEILSKPTKLSEIEFSLIKEHARQGYEILKNVEYPTNLAEIVGQHHERIDGSGYPRNLKGNAILIEACILAVADVVEAMASHRPYRPGLGLDAALEEIEKNKGIIYDDAVADACLRLFREKVFKLGEI